MRHLILVTGLLFAIAWGGTPVAGVAEILPDEPLAGPVVDGAASPPAQCDPWRCGPAACDPCACVACPRWKVEADALFLHRSEARSATLLVSADRTVELGNTRELDLGFAVGPRLALSRCTSLGEIQFVYFGIDGWSSQRTVERDGDIILPYWDWDGIVLDRAWARYESELYNFELNFKRPLLREINWLAGFRTVELHERAEAAIDALNTGTDWGTLRFGDINHLYGFQLGLEGVLWRPSPRLSFEGDLKAGIYGNHINGNAWGTGTLGDIGGGATINHTAFLGELALTADYQLSRHLALVAGYQVMWIEGVALAPEVLTSDSFDDIARGSPFYHGAMAGLKATW